MKLAPLLAQYLYDHKTLQLTGIGKFLLDSTARKTTDSQHLSEGISFENNSSAQENEALINYISAETGKMKTLAAADLSSYVELARQFLNIGKPFQIEGIGTLVKMRSGELEFTADHLIADKGKESGIKELSATSISDDSLTTYENLKPRSEGSPVFKKFFLGVLSIATVALIVWIGYRTYKSNSPKPTKTEPVISEPVVTVSDTAKSNPQLVAAASTKNEVADGKYKFVIEVAKKKRAYYRYNILRKGNVPIEIATTDSVSYKLYFTLPATASDTARITDSLSTWYPSITHQKAYAER